MSYCSNCGYKFEGKENFCPSCGVKIEKKKQKKKNNEESINEEKTKKVISNETKEKIKQFLDVKDISEEFSKEEVENSNKFFIRDNSVWTFPCIEIFCGKDLIHKEYFTKFATLEQHVNYNYPNCKIKYE